MVTSTAGRVYFGGPSEATAFATVFREMPSRAAICVFGIPSPASLRIKAQSSKVITLQSLSAHFSTGRDAQFSTVIDTDRHPGEVWQGVRRRPPRGNGDSKGGFPLRLANSPGVEDRPWWRQWAGSPSWPWLKRFDERLRSVAGIGWIVLGTYFFLIAVLGWFAPRMVPGLAFGGVGASAARFKEARRGRQRSAEVQVGLVNKLGCVAALVVAGAGVVGVAIFIGARARQHHLPPVPLGGANPAHYIAGDPCPSRAVQAVHNDAAGLRAHLVPVRLNGRRIDSAHFCRWAGQKGQPPLGLVEDQSLPSGAAQELASRLNRLLPGRKDMISCPVNDASAALMVFSYGRGADVDVRMALTGCQIADNGVGYAFAPFPFPLP